MEGILHVTVHSAKDLPPRDKTGKSDPYCVFEVNGRKYPYTTTMKSQTLNPVWDESFKMQLHNAHTIRYEKEGELMIELWDWDRYSPDDFIGRVFVPLSFINQNGEKGSWPLQSKSHFNEKVYGHLSLFVRVEWLQTAPLQSTFGERLQQKVGAKLNQFARFGAQLVSHQIANIQSWGKRRTTDVLGKVTALKPPQYTFTKELLKEVKHATHFSADELELLFYAFRSFSHPLDQMDTKRFRKIFPLLKEEREIVDKVFDAFNQRTNDDLCFDEFVLSLSMVTRGNADERLKMAASFFSKNGEIEKASFLEYSWILIDVMKAPFNRQQVEALANKLFETDVKITSAQFIERMKVFEAEKNAITNQIQNFFQKTKDAVTQHNHHHHHH